MKVKIVESNSPPLHEGARIREISEDQAKLLFECEDDSELGVTIIDPGNSVSVRDKNNQIEYLGSKNSTHPLRDLAWMMSFAVNSFSRRRSPNCSANTD